MIPRSPAYPWLRYAVEFLIALALVIAVAAVP